MQRWQNKSKRRGRKRRRRRRRMRKSKSKVDRISKLPDCLIQRILSFLPSTKDAVRTSVLSKQWKNQWTAVPVLTFKSKDCRYIKNILEFYDRSKIEKFHLEYNTRYVVQNIRFDEIVSFATSRHVEDLTLICSRSRLPELFFNNDSLRKLRADWCCFVPKGMVNWARLKVLNLRLCSLSNQAMEHILVGSPLLEYFEINHCDGFDKLVITSKSLKNLRLQSVGIRVFEISCPDLKELSLCHSLLLDQPELAVASESLKRLHIEHVKGIRCLKVSCKKLETLALYDDLELDKVELMNLPPSVYAVLDFTLKRDSSKKEIYERLVRDILRQLHHVHELKLGRWLVEVLSGLEAREPLSPVLQTKVLILYAPGREGYKSGMARLLHNLPMLKTLIFYKEGYKLDYFMELTDIHRKYPDFTVFNFSASHQKTIGIIGSKEFLSSPRWSLPAIRIDDYVKRTKKANQGETHILIFLLKR